MAGLVLRVGGVSAEGVNRHAAASGSEASPSALTHASDCESNVGFYAPGIPAPCTCGVARTELPAPDAVCEAAPWACACFGVGLRSAECGRCLTCGTFAPWVNELIVTGRLWVPPERDPDPSPYWGPL